MDCNNNSNKILKKKKENFVIIQSINKLSNENLPASSDVTDVITCKGYVDHNILVLKKNIIDTCVSPKDENYVFNHYCRMHTLNMQKTLDEKKHNYASELLSNHMNNEEYHNMSQMITNDIKKRRYSDMMEKNSSESSSNEETDIQDMYIKDKGINDRQKVTFQDRRPNRICNPLLELPQYPPVPKGTLPSSLPIEIVPKGSELWNIIQIYFPEADTFPLSYLARILGFNISQNSISNEEYFDYDQIIKRKPNRTNDPWYKIPKLGNFYNRVISNRQLVCGVPSSNMSNNDTEYEEEMDFVDPLWNTIVKTYRGNKDNIFKEAILSHSDAGSVVSCECLDFARKCNIVNKDFSFRLARQGDEESIFRLCEHSNQYCNANTFTQILKCSSQFLIIAVNNTSGYTIGFIHYKFSWFKLEEYNKSKNTIDKDLISESNRISTPSSYVKKDTSLELVLHLEGTFIKKEVNNMKYDKNNNIALVLTALAIDHAQRLDVWYGVLETTSALIQFYKIFFRMDELNRTSEDLDGEKVSKIFMACDLNKINHQHAFLVRKELMTNEHKKYCTETYDQIIKERMIVRLLNTNYEVISRQHVDNIESKKSVVENSITKKNITNQPYSGKKDKVESSVNIRIKIEIPEINESKSVEIMGNNITSNQKPEIIKNITIGKTSILKKDDNNLTQNLDMCKENVDWEVLKSFPLDNHSRYKSRTRFRQIQNDGSDDVLDKILKVQNDLRQLEDNMTEKVEKLFRKAYQERLEFQNFRIEMEELEEANIMAAYNAIIERRCEADKAWQMQLEQDMDAVCDICHDGEVTVENQILFCEACNVAIHQRCYGIENVPSGDYFCHPCRYFGRDRHASHAVKNGTVFTQNTPSPLPICCELCPRRQGAFYKTYAKVKSKYELNNPKWVHVLCAKWQGLNFVSPGCPEKVIEDVTELKECFFLQKIQCCLCQGERGSYNKCRHEGCDKWMHVTCARSSGVCNVCHGENNIGLIDSPNVWTLACPEHSKFDSGYSPLGCLTMDQLITAAKMFPQELKREISLKKFPEMNAVERKYHLDDTWYEQEFLCTLMKMNEGLRCQVCDSIGEKYKTDRYSNLLSRCYKCQVTVHKSCIFDQWKVETIDGSTTEICSKCIFIEEHSSSPSFEMPCCHMCNDPGGPLVVASAKSLNKNWWKDRNSIIFNKSLFGKKIWCHPVCAIWCPNTIITQNHVDCTNVIMSNGFSHIDSKSYCKLCGRKDKVKIQCSHSKCSLLWETKKNSCRFHVTCARQAGFKILENENVNGEVDFTMKCFSHFKPHHVLRMLLVDMIKVEKDRAGNSLEKSKDSMSYEFASKIFNQGIRVLRFLSWAWRWSEWLITDEDNEYVSRDEEIKKVPCTSNGRDNDELRYLLAQFGAALRNRDYDKEEKDDRVALGFALRSILSTASLVGPLTTLEIEFCTDWLARVYRSKSPLLGIGRDKILVEETFVEGSFVHNNDGTPKFSLGINTVPGKINHNENDIIGDIIHTQDRILS